MNQPGAVFEVGVVPHHEADRLGSIEDPGPRTDKNLTMRSTLADLDRFGKGRSHRQVLQLVGSFDVRPLSDPNILDRVARFDDGLPSHEPVVSSSGIENLVGKLVEPLHKQPVFAVRRPQKRIGGNHSVKGSDAPAFRLVDDIDGDEDLGIFSVLHDAVAELRMVGALHLPDPIEHHLIVDDVVA